MQDHSGVAGVSRGRQLQNLRCRRCLRVHPPEKGPPLAAGKVPAAGRHQPAIREDQEVGSADEHVQILPVPLRVRRLRGSDLGAVLLPVAPQQADCGAIVPEHDGGFVGGPASEEDRNQGLEPEPIFALVETDELVLCRPVAGGPVVGIAPAVCCPLMPSDPPEQEVGFGHPLRRAPFRPVPRKPDQRVELQVVLGQIPPVQSQRHETPVRGHFQLGVSQVLSRFPGKVGTGGPGLSIRRADDPDGPVGGDVTLSLAENAVPAVLEADQIGERAMGSPVPDLPDRDQLSARRPAAGGQGRDQEQGKDWLAKRHSILDLRFGPGRV